MKDRFELLLGRHEIFLGIYLICALITLKFFLGDAIHLAITCFIVLCVLATVFPMIYGITSRGLWAKSQTGKTMMTQGVIVAMLLDFTLLNYFGLVPETLLLYASIVLYTGLALVKISLIRMVLRVRAPKWFRINKNKERAV